MSSSHIQSDINIENNHNIPNNLHRYLIKTENRNSNIIDDCYINNLPKEILCKIFANSSTSDSLIIENGFTVSKCWNTILGDINQAVHFFKFENNKIDYHETMALLKCTKTIPTQETINKLNWEIPECNPFYLSRGMVIENKYFKLFCETYHPELWRNMPSLSWKDIFDSKSDDNARGLDISSIFRSSLKSQHRLEIVLKLLEENYKNRIIFSARLLNRWNLPYSYSQNHISEDFIDMLIRKGYCPITPSGLINLLEHNFPSELILQYINMKINDDWDDYKGETSYYHDGQIPLRYSGTGKDNAIKAILSYYEYTLFTTIHENGIIFNKFNLIPLDHPLIRDFCLFYKLSKSEDVREIFLTHQNILMNLNKNCYHTRSRYLKWIESILVLCSDVHPLNTIKSNNWYETTNDFIMVHNQ